MGFQPEVYVDISNEIDDKITAISKHQSQNGWMSTFMKDDFQD